MPTGISIHVGLNYLDAGHYLHTHELLGCVGDAEAMRDLAAAAGFEPRILLNENATSDAVLGAIAEAGRRVGNDGIVLLTYSGHGARVRDVGGSRPGDHGDEKDGYDESWCMFDREVLDDEMYHVWVDFPPGARVLVVSDSCFSGDMIRDDDEDPIALPEKPTVWGAHVLDETREALKPYAAELAAARARIAANAGRDVPRGGGPLARGLSFKVANAVYGRNHREYDQRREKLRALPRRPVQADVMLLSAAQDNETAEDGEKNGAFTRELLDVWNGGAFEGTYVTLHAELFRRLAGRAPGQRPQLTALRPPSFSGQRPFTI